MEIHTWLNTSLVLCMTSVKAIVVAFYKEKAIVVAFSESCFLSVLLQVWSAKCKSPRLALVPLAAVLPGGGGLELGEAEAGVVAVQQRAVETLVAVEVAGERELFALTILGTPHINLPLFCNLISTKPPKPPPLLCLLRLCKDVCSP